jgi:hypothetical protein
VGFIKGFSHDNIPFEFSISLANPRRFHVGSTVARGAKVNSGCRDKTVSTTFSFSKACIEQVE